MSIDELKRWPLLALHAHLERIEQRIDEEAHRIGGETLERWLDFHADDDVDYLRGVDQGLRNYFDRVAEIVREKERAEIAALLLGRAA